MVCCLVTRYHITGEIPIALIPHHQDNHATPTWQTTEHNSVLTNMHPYLTQIPLKNPPYPTRVHSLCYREIFPWPGLNRYPSIPLFCPHTNTTLQQHNAPPKDSQYDEICLRQAPAYLNHQTYQTTVPYHLRQTLAPPIPHIQKTYIITRTELTLKVPPDYANPID